MQQSLLVTVGNLQTQCYVMDSLLLGVGLWQKAGSLKCQAITISLYSNLYDHRVKLSIG